MLYSSIFGKTSKTAPKDEISVNAKLLIKAGFVDKLMAGSYTLLFLGKKVEKKIENVIRKEIDKTGAQEILMPLLHPKKLWNETGRWETAKEIMYQLEKNGKELALSFTHEEIVLDLVRKHAVSYKDFPVKIYHFSTKFRDEPRVKSGVLRGREFLMKDLYSIHTSEKELEKYYWEVAEAYKKIFSRFGLQTKVVEAAGGVFTDSITHEFQVLCSAGEDTIFYCIKCDFAQNKDIAKVKSGDKCPKCSGEIKESKAIEVGNIFKFGTSYSQKMNIYFINEKGQKQLTYLGSYGIGITRLIGTLVEMFHDDRGIIWPEIAAPFSVHLLGLNLEDELTKKNAKRVYQFLIDNEVEVLFDDREGVGAGEKFSDSDLIGIPVRLVVSKNTGNKIEFKKRVGDKTELLSLDDVLNRVK